MKRGIGYAGISNMKRALIVGVGALSGLCGYSVYRRNVVEEKSENAKLEDNFKLKLVQIVFRHGARTPLSSPDYLPKVDYDKDLMDHGEHTYVPYDTKDTDGQKVSISRTIYGMKPSVEKENPHGQLTAKGAHQMYELGCYLRDRYVTELKFLSPTYTDEIYVRSTSIKRAVESARCTLAGLYPDQETPIPIEIANLKSEVLFPNFERCEYLQSLTRWSWHFPDLIDGMKEEREKIQDALDITNHFNVHLVTLRDCLSAHHFHGVLPDKYNVPELMKQIDAAALKIMDHVFAGFNHTRETALTLGIGPLLQVFLDNIQTSVDGTSKTKLRLFSGHDTTLMPLLHAFGIHDSYWTPYGANITLELYEASNHDEDSSEHFVRVLYEHKEKLVPGCSSSMCPVKEFQKALSKFLLDEDEYHSRCRVKNDTLLESLPKPTDSKS